VESALNLNLACLEFSKMSRFSFGDQQAKVMRLTFVGELGFELHVPTGAAQSVYLALRASAEHLSAKHGFPVEDAGYRCIDSLSAEKGFRHWHADLSNEDTPAEAGIGFVALPKLKSGATFLGSEALSRQRVTGLSRRLVCLSVSGSIPLHGGETLWRDGECVGYVKSTSYGHSVGRTIAYGYCKSSDGSKVTNTWLQAGTYEIVDKGKAHCATLHLKAPFDPDNERVKGSY
jgi:sarcosine dehydrogenase